MKRRMRLLVTTILMPAVLLSACGFGGPNTAATTTTIAAEPVRYVALGGGESTDGDIESEAVGYPRVLFRDLLPAQTTYTNLASNNAGLFDLVNRQVGTALDLGPTLVTLWVDEALLDERPDVDDPETAVRSAIEALVDSGASVGVTSGRGDGAWSQTVEALTAQAGATYVDIPPRATAVELATLFADALSLGA